jgi:hypothetical protein
MNQAEGLPPKKINAKDERKDVGGLKKRDRQGGSLYPQPLGCTEHACDGHTRFFKQDVLI